MSSSNSASNETTPLIPPAVTAPTHTRPPRTVTFNPHVSSSSSSSLALENAARRAPPGAFPSHAAPSGGSSPAIVSGEGLPVISAINSKIRRRHSQGANPALGLALVGGGGGGAGMNKIGPQRTTKTAEKLKLLPNPEHGKDGPDEESGRDVYAQFTRIKDPMSRRDAARLGKDDRKNLPRVTAYCTAGSYRMGELMRYLKVRNRSRGAAPKLFDECVYTPYNYSQSSHAAQATATADGDERFTQQQARRYSDSVVDVDNDQLRSSLIDLREENSEQDPMSRFYPSRLPEFGPHETDEGSREPVFDTEVHTPEVFLFNYGTVVIWGMTLQQEQRFLKEIAKFEVEKLAKDDVQTEDFNFYYTREYQARIYNDFISLMDKNYMTKLAISHALSQSVKTSLFEDLVDNTIETTKDIPSQIALTGKVNLTRREINMQIGELFILRINIHLQGSVLDAPELMWAEPQLDPIYQAVRSYLEMDQRVSLLTERVEVIADLLAVLKDQLTHTHGEYLEWIVIVLIAAEIVVAAVNIVVDLYAGV